jgi:hypothetical protein
MAKKKKKKKVKSSIPRRSALRLLKIPLIILVLLAALLVAGHFLVIEYQESIANSVIEKLEQKTEGRYSIKYKSVELNLLARGIRLENLTITPRTEKIKKTAVSAHLSYLELKGVSFWDLLINKRLSVSHISIKSGKLHLTRPNPRPGESPDTIVYIPKFFLDLKHLSISLKKKKQGRPFPPIKFSSGLIRLTDPVYYTRDGFYRLDADTLKLQTTGFSFFITGFRLTPRYKKYEFSRQKGRQCDRLSLKTAAITGADLDLRKLLDSRAFSCREVTVQNPVLEIFRNKKRRRKPGPRKDRFPRQLLQRIKFPLTLDHLKMVNGFLSYTELAPDSRRPGTLFMDRIDIRLDRLTNKPDPDKKPIPLQLNAEGRLMGKGEFKVKIRVPLDSRNNAFTVSASMGRMNLRELNRILVRNANLRVERGSMDSLRFSIGGNNREAKGEMVFRYRGLKVSALKKGGSYKKRWFFSFLANFAIPGDNPKHGKPPRIGNIYYLKEGPMSFFSYIGKALVTGLKSSVGLKKGKSKKKRKRTP